MSIPEDPVQFVQDFLNIVTNSTTTLLTGDTEWQQIYSSKKANLVVASHKTIQNCYLVQVVFDQSLGACYDILATRERLKYDTLIEQLVELKGDIYSSDSSLGSNLTSSSSPTSKTLKQFSLDNVSFDLDYLKMKAIWPISARYAVLLKAKGKLNDGRYFLVTKSIDDSDTVDSLLAGSAVSVGNSVRMEMGLSGFILSKLGPGQCKCIQIMNVDLKGYVPKSVISIATSREIPNTFKRLNEVFKNMPQENQQESIYLNTLLASKRRNSRKDLKVTTSSPKEDYQSVVALEGNIGGRKASSPLATFFTPITAGLPFFTSSKPIPDPSPDMIKMMGHLDLVSAQVDSLSTRLDAMESVLHAVRMELQERQRPFPKYLAFSIVMLMSLLPLSIYWLSVTGVIDIAPVTSQKESKTTFLPFWP